MRIAFPIPRKGKCRWPSATGATSFINALSTVSPMAVPTGLVRPSSTIWQWTNWKLHLSPVELSDLSCSTRWLAGLRGRHANYNLDGRFLVNSASALTKWSVAPVATTTLPNGSCWSRDSGCSVPSLRSNGGSNGPSPDPTRRANSASRNIATRATAARARDHGPQPGAIQPSSTLKARRRTFEYRDPVATRTSPTRPRPRRQRAHEQSIPALAHRRQLHQASRRAHPACQFGTAQPQTTRPHSCAHAPASRPCGVDSR